MEEKQITEELGNVLSYMTDILYKEFNTHAISPEYLITALLENKKSHAYMLLDSLLMSNNIENLKSIYLDYLKNNTNKNVFRFTKNIPFNQELTKIIADAEKEKDILNAPLMGSEHILLAMLKQENNNTSIIEAFKSIGIDYNIIFSKCINRLKANNGEKKNQKPNFIIPLKSEVNPKAITTKTNYIEQYAININNLVKTNKIDSLIGRSDEVNRIIKVLARRKKNNAILVGNGGVGKTQIVYGIAEMIVNNAVPDILKGKEIIMLNIVALVSGTHFRGMFEERVNGLFDELKNNKNYILLIDDMHNVLKSGSKEKDTDISSMINSVLSEGDVRVIGTTTFKEYRNAIETNTSICRKLQKIVIEPTSKAETLTILQSCKQYYEDYHNVNYSVDVLKKCIDLADRYITDRGLPDSAIDLLDLSGAHTCLVSREPSYITDMRTRIQEIEKEKELNLNNGNFEQVDILDKENNRLKLELADFNRSYEANKEQYKIDITVDDIARAVSDMTSIPVQKLNVDEKTKFANIENVIKQSVVGQDDAVDKICKAVKRTKLGLGIKNKPSSFLLIGQSGCGKTLLAKKLAEEVYGSEKELIRIDMSEYSEKSSVAKLLGSAPGYIGHENGGQLTEAIKNKPHCVLLLDEIEKADSDVYNVFLQLFDEGRLTDNGGQVVNFKNVIVIMTSNVGAKQASELGGGIGFVTNESDMKKTIFTKQLKQTFPPEFINRIDQIVYFNPLSNDNLRDIVILEINKFIKRLNEISYNLEYDDETVDLIFNQATSSKEYGARPIIRLIQEQIEDKITELMFQNEYETNYTFKTFVKDGYIDVK